jgi:hypothetical protein
VKNSSRTTRRMILTASVIILFIISVLVVILIFQEIENKSTYRYVDYQVMAPRMSSEWLVVNITARVYEVSISNNATPPVKNLILPRFQSLSALNHTYLGFLFFNISRWYNIDYYNCSSIWLNMTATPPQAFCVNTNGLVSSSDSYLGTYIGPWPVYDDAGNSYNFSVNYGWYQDPYTGILYIHYTTFDSDFATITVKYKDG